MLRPLLRTGSIAVLASALLVLPKVAHADEGEGWRHDFVFGAHVGLAHPGGQPGAGAAPVTPTVSDLATTYIPFGLDAGLFLSSWVYVGATLDGGPTIEQQRGACFSCGVGSVVHGEGEVRLFVPQSLFTHPTFDPWLSLGSGWEVMHASFDGGTSSADYDGPVLADIRLGLDIHAGNIAMGPFFGVAFAEFVGRSLEPAPPGLSDTITDRTVHEWFTLGLRGTYRPF